MSDPHDNPTLEAWRTAALKCPETVETPSCSNVAFKARKKAFFFMGAKDEGYLCRLKLGDSLDEAAKLAKAEPERYEVGLHGWMAIRFPHDETPPEGLLERWMDESFRLLAPKTLVRTLPKKE